MNTKSFDTPNAVIYARVSSVGERQSTTRQVADLSTYAAANSLAVDKVFEEHISGAKANKERPVLNECKLPLFGSLMKPKNEKNTNFCKNLRL
jgi:predicted site-specific integrase-resolvase